MHKLTRQVRFSIMPFLSEDRERSNSLASAPADEGLSVFLELSVELIGKVGPTTGFVVNVTHIEQAIRESVIPMFTERLRTDFRERRPIGLSRVVEFLRLAWDQLADKFGIARLSRLSLKLNPFRELAIESKESAMIYFSQKFDFAAAHKLWNDELPEQRNIEIFGKCANPTGHGHNYTVEITVKRPPSENNFRIGEFERTVNDQLIEVLDHKNLNLDVAEFHTTNPTVENIAVFAWHRLAGKFTGASLHCVTVWETDQTRCSYYG